MQRSIQPSAGTRPRAHEGEQAEQGARRGAGQPRQRSDEGTRAPMPPGAADASSYMTGSVLTADGGTSASVGAAPYDEGLFGLHEAVMPHDLGARVMPAA